MLLLDRKTKNKWIKTISKSFLFYLHYELKKIRRKEKYHELYQKTEDQPITQCQDKLAFAKNQDGELVNELNDIVDLGEDFERTLVQELKEYHTMINRSYEEAVLDNFSEANGYVVYE